MGASRPFGFLLKPSSYIEADLDTGHSEFLAAGFSRAQVLEVIMVVATKTISNYVNHITKTPLDDFMAATKWVAPRDREQAA